MPNQDTDSRREAQPMTSEQLAALRLFLDDEFSGVTCHWPMTALRSIDRTLAARDHWRAMYQQGLEAYGDAHRDLEAMTTERDRLAALLECARVVTRADECALDCDEASPCIYCRSAARLDAHFNSGAGS